MQLIRMRSEISFLGGIDYHLNFKDTEIAYTCISVHLCPYFCVHTGCFHAISTFHPTVIFLKCIFRRLLQISVGMSRCVNERKSYKLH